MTSPREIIELNLDAIENLVIERYRQRTYTIGQMSGTRYLQIVLELADLKNANLVLPAGAAAAGFDATGVTAPAGGAGVRSKKD
ncbi:MAG: hypothetical protein WDN46_06855 [Methylocella sp.]